MKILIAEDDLISRLMLEKLSLKWGFEPIIAEDGGQAWDVLQQKDPPQLLLIDWEMPRLTGLALCQRVRRQETGSNPCYIILLTSRNQTVDIVTGLEVGANDYVTKPFNNIELQARVHVGERMLKLQHDVNEAKELLAFQATHDVLSGLLNRRAIMDGLAKEISRTNRQQEPLCIAMCDIDFFKKINDGYGHLMGDEVIREVAQRIAATVRPYDLVGRYGGEEFLLVFNSDKENGISLLERIRHTIYSSVYTYEGVSLEATISIGLAVFDPPMEALDCQKMIDCADKALYQAKKNGRNRVELA